VSITPLLSLTYPCAYSVCSGALTCYRLALNVTVFMFRTEWHSHVLQISTDYETWCLYLTMQAPLQMLRAIMYHAQAIDIQGTQASHLTIVGNTPTTRAATTMKALPA